MLLHWYFTVSVLQIYFSFVMSYGKKKELNSSKFWEAAYYVCLVDSHCPLPY